MWGSSCRPPDKPWAGTHAFTELVLAEEKNPSAVSGFFGVMYLWLSRVNDSSMYLKKRWEMYNCQWITQPWQTFSSRHRWSQHPIFQIFPWTSCQPSTRNHHPGQCGLKGSLSFLAGVSASGASSFSETLSSSTPTIILFSQAKCRYNKILVNWMQGYSLGCSQLDCWVNLYHPAHHFLWPNSCGRNICHKDLYGMQTRYALDCHPITREWLEIL